jgi:hypothetical protein
MALANVDLRGYRWWLERLTSTRVTEGFRLVFIAFSFLKGYFFQSQPGLRVSMAGLSEGSSLRGVLEKRPNEF